MMGHDQYVPFNAPELSGDEIRKLHEESKADMEALNKRMGEIIHKEAEKFWMAISEAVTTPKPPWLF